MGEVEDPQTYFASLSAPMSPAFLISAALTAAKRQEPHVMWPHGVSVALVGVQ